MNPLKVYDSVFSAELLEKLSAFTRVGSHPSRVNFFNWNPQIVQSSNAIFFFDLSDELKEQVIDELIKKEVIKAKPKKFAANVALYSRQSFIPWHDDRTHLFSITVYLNKEWNIDWGGYFVYEDENKELKAIPPIFNNCIAFDTPLNHSVFLTNLNAPLRESLQLFIDEF
jgi:Rps23 Pro-64 3,4-dihydroxylase Tpa1-like proline 4-hydroxylase